MASTAMRSVPAFVPEALIASRVGTWETDFVHDRTACDETTAALFSLDPDAAARGLPNEAFLDGIHPEDLDGLQTKLAQVRAHGGLFVVEYRTHPARGATRWLLARGRYERDPRAGTLTGRGIVIDITEGKRDGHAEDRAFFVESHENAGPLDRAAVHAIEVRRAVDELGERERPGLRSAVDALLWVVGQALARRSGGPEA